MKDEDELSLEDKDAYFVSYREVKIDNKRVKIYLTKGGVSKHTEVLAVVGEESGTSVKYRNAANFTNHGKLKTDSKKVLLEWLDGIVAIGLLVAGLWLDTFIRLRVARRGEPAPTNNDQRIARSERDVSSIS